MTFCIPTHFNTWLRRLALAVILFLAAGLRLWYFDWGLPLLLHPDEWSQADVAWRIAAGDLNPHFFRYSTGYMYFLAPLLKGMDWLAGPLTQADRYAAVRVITALLGTGTVWLLWRWARLVVPAVWALGAAALLAINPTHVIHSHYATVDVPLTFAVCISGYALTLLALASPEQRRRRTYVCAAAVGLAIGVKYTAVLLVMPFIAIMVAYAPAGLRRPGNGMRALLVGSGALVLGMALLYWLNLPRITQLAAQLTTDGHLEKEYLDLLNTILWGLIGTGSGLLLLATRQLAGLASRLVEPLLLQSLVIIVLMFACTSPFVFLDYRHAAVDIFYEYRHAKIGAAAQYAEGSGIARSAVQDNLVGYTRQLWSDFGPFAIMSLIGIVSWALRDRRLALAIGLLSAVMFTTLVNSGNTADRYLLPAYPGLCLAAMAGLCALSTRGRYARLCAAGAYGAACILVGSVLYTQLDLFALPDTRSIAHTWIGNHVPAGSLVANENYTQTPNLGDLPVTQILANRNFDPAARWDGHADYLLLGAAGSVEVPKALDILRQRYGPPVMVVPAEPAKDQGPAQYLFRLPARPVSVGIESQAAGSPSQRGQDE